METKEEYVKKHIYAAFQYEKDVLSGKILVNKLIKQAVDRRQKLKSVTKYREDKLRDLYAFIYYINIFIKGEKERFNPLPWQDWIMMNVYSSYRKDNEEKRLFRYVVIWVARKSGKSFWASILALYGFMKEDRNAQVYMLSNTKSQASIILDYAKTIVKDSPALNKRIKRQQYQLKYDGNGTCIYKALASDSETLDGLSNNIAILDERHAFSDNSLFSIMSTGMLFRDNPIIFSISTAGTDKDFPFYAELDIGRRVLNDELDDNNTFYALYTLDDDDDMSDSSLWIKSNPSLHHITQLEDMINDYKKAKLSITDTIQFQIKNLNVYADSVDSWISDESYSDCFLDSKIDELKGEKAYLGVDLSATRDLAALSIVVENPETGVLESKTEFYFPTKDNEANKIRKSGIDLTSWISKGWIEAHDNKIIDYDKIFDRIQYYTENYDVQGLSYDPFGAQILMSQLESKLFIDLIPARQNFGFYNFPMKYIERLVYSKRINLSKNPVLRWCFRNVVIATDLNGYIRPVKNKSKDSIDGLVSVVMAIGLYINVNWDSVEMLMDEYNKELEQ